ncbi:MAG: cytochrome c family protein [Pseudomonadota bacterium]
MTAVAMVFAGAAVAQTATPDDAASASSVTIAPEIVAEYASLTGDAAKGKRVFFKCISCHAVAKGQNKVGPSLHGVVGRPAGSIDGFKYSDANANSGIVWTEETLFAYLEKPQEFLKGTRMAFPGLPSAQERADLIAYLKAEGAK